MTKMFSRLVVCTGALWLFAFPAILHAQKFVHAYSSISALNATFWIVQDAGFAKQEGLDTELVYIPSSSTVAQAMLAVSSVAATVSPISRPMRSSRRIHALHCRSCARAAA